MPDIDDILDDLLRREGGYVDDPDDPGGATNHGVTIHTLHAHGMDVNGDGAVTKADVRDLTAEQAREVYLRHYYRAPHIWRLPDALQPSVFDMYVNAGSNAVRILQRLLRDMGQSVTVDGIIGQQTEQATKEAMALAPRHLVDAYGIARRNYYFRIADGRPKSRKYVVSRKGGKGGWIKRAEEFISLRYHMTDNEFNLRVAQWG